MLRAKIQITNVLSLEKAEIIRVMLAGGVFGQELLVQLEFKEYAEFW